MSVLTRVCKTRSVSATLKQSLLPVFTTPRRILKYVLLQSKGLQCRVRSSTCSNTEFNRQHAVHAITPCSKGFELRSRSTGRFSPCVRRTKRTDSCSGLTFAGHYCFKDWTQSLYDRSLQIIPDLDRVLSVPSTVRLSGIVTSRTRTMMFRFPHLKSSAYALRFFRPSSILSIE